MLLSAFVRFVTEGSGTPAPVAPTQRLVVGGLYRYVRNPMYLAVLAIIIGQAIVLWRPVLVGYAAVVALAFFVFVRVYEEPTLQRAFGDEYDAYRSGRSRMVAAAPSLDARSMWETRSRPLIGPVGYSPSGIVFRNVSA